MSATTETLHKHGEILLQVFEQLEQNPNQEPRIPLDQFPEGTKERRLLDSFMSMIAQMRAGESTDRNSRQRYEELVNTVDGIVWEADADTLHFTFVSKQAEKMLGYPTERWTSEPTFWQDHIYSEDQVWAPDFCVIATAERRDHQLEYRMVAADGRVVWLRDIVTVVIEEEQPIKLRGVMIDITERKEQEQQYRSIFEATTDGLVINDIQGRIIEVNPAFCAMHGYSYEEMLQLDPRQFIRPADHALFREFIETVSAGGVFHGRAMDIRKDGTMFHVEVNGTSFHYRGQQHVLGVVRDISERVEAYELLEQRVQERTRELGTLLDISHNVASNLELMPLLKSIIEELHSLTDFSSASISVIADVDLLVWQVRGQPIASRERPVVRRESKSPGGLWPMLTDGEPVLIPDVRADTALAISYRDGMARHLGVDMDRMRTLLETDQRHVRSWVGVPLRLKERVVGALSVTHDETNYYNSAHADLLMAVANQAGVAIENALLYEESRATARSTTAQAQVASRVALGGPLATTLDDVCGHVIRATGALAATAALLDSEAQQVHIISSHGLPDQYRAALEKTMQVDNRSAFEALAGPQPLVMNGMAERVLRKPEWAGLHSFMLEAAWDKVVGMPMIYQGTPVGVLFCYHAADHEITAEEMSFHSVIADQAAVAVINARLLDETQQTAAREQRQHLARELHDSVSQALFSINLTARSIEIMLKRDNTLGEDVSSALGDLRGLTAGAMAEMRALIFELRPGALEEEGLLAALRKHAAAVQGRERIEVTVDAPNAANLPRLKPTAEEALYRIAQEALHNVVKHARASKIGLFLGIDPADGRFITLRISDNGVGFDQSEVPAGHMGLGTMGERATALAAEYRVLSSPGAGTTVIVRVPLEKWRLSE